MISAAAYLLEVPHTCGGLVTCSVQHHELVHSCADALYGTHNRLNMKNYRPKPWTVKRPAAVAAMKSILHLHL
jgi:hypothetical protein